ncbi:MAG: hypothetical protein ACK5YO_03330, partial [Planctomyces sp.]
MSVTHFQVKQFPRCSGNHSLLRPAKTRQRSGDCQESGPKTPAWHFGSASVYDIAVRSLDTGACESD